MEGDSVPGWFFSPPVGPSLGNASLDEVLRHLARDDDYWSVEAPATEDEYCRENWAPLIYSDASADGVRVNAVIYYIDRGLFTIGVRGSAITDWSAANDPETGERLDVPFHWLDAYPVVNDRWDEFVDVSRQGEIYRYPAAVAVERDKLAEIVRCLFETKSLYRECDWLTEMEYARRHRRWFHVGEDG